MKTKKEILLDDKAPCTALIKLIIQEYGTECFDWEPPVLKAELQDDFECELSDLQSDKLQAAILVLTTDMFESHINVFVACCKLLNSHPADIDEFDVLEAEELICGLTEAYMIRGEKLDFSPEVRLYAGQVFYDYGMHKPPTLFPDALMKEREGDDSEKNAALQEIFDEKIKTTEEYVRNAQVKQKP